MVHLMNPGPAMLACSPGPVYPLSNVTSPKAWVLKRFQYVGLVLVELRLISKGRFLPIFVLGSASKRSHGVFRSEHYKDKGSKSCEGL